MASMGMMVMVMVLWWMWMMVWKTIRSEDADAAKLHCCLLSQNTFKCERDLSLMLMDWWILLLLQQEDAVNNFHIMAIPH